jgi:Domain of unknown function (DUF4395)
MTGQVNFVRQQGFRDATSEGCSLLYPALMWQPRIIAALVLVGLVFQWWPYFLAQCALLWWNALLPRFNVFDALYNRFGAKPKGLPRLVPAPGPRRFAQGVAGTFMLAIALSLASDRIVLAWVFEGFLLAALAALIFGRFCLGSYAFHLFTGQAGFANRTLPWSRDDSSAGAPNPAKGGSW